MNQAAILLADVGDVIGLLIGVIFVIIAVVGQILTKLREMQQPPRRQPGQPPQGVPPQARPPQARPPQGRPPQAGPLAGPQPAANPLEDEIRQFLRGAAERREIAAGGRGPRPVPPKPAPPPIIATPPVEAEVVQPELSHLREQLQQGKSKTLVSALDTDVALADDKMTSHLHEVFDHRLGTLGGTVGEAARPSATPAGDARKAVALSLPSTAAAGMAAMLADRQNLRTAILVSEILRRPEDRWG